MNLNDLQIYVNKKTLNVYKNTNCVWLYLNPMVLSMVGGDFAYSSSPRGIQQFLETLVVWVWGRVLLVFST